MIEKDGGCDMHTSKALIALGTDWIQCKIKEVAN